MKSIWLEDSKKRNYPSLKGENDTDVLIIGGGLSGLSLAYELRDSSYRILLLEQNRLYHATTGYTTGKVTFQHGKIYSRLCKDFGEKTARAYYKGNREAIAHLEDIIGREKIDCDYSRCDTVLYLNRKDAEEEKTAYRKLGIGFEESPSGGSIGLKVRNQAVFHVVKYLDGILNALEGNPAVSVYENSKVERVSGKIAYGKDFRVHAKFIVFASAYPCYRRFNFYFLRLRPSLSFIGAAKTEQGSSFAGIREDKPVFSFRPLNGEQMLFAGYSEETRHFPSYRDIALLEKTAQESFRASPFFNVWVNQDYASVEGKPLIGRIKENLFFAGGYNKWGISTSVLASMILKDLILRGESEYEAVFSLKKDRRYLPVIMSFFGNVPTFIRSRIPLGKKKCTHLHCGLRYNPVSKTFDCPCHGSRFDEAGKNLIGPAKKDL